MDAMIAVLPGDGIGPEVTTEAVRVLQAVAARWGHRFELREAPVGGRAIDVRGRPLPEETAALCREADAVLLGAVGGPRWSDPTARARPEQGLLELRRLLGAFANLRPVRVHPRLKNASPVRPERLVDVDILFVRELTGGLYYGAKSRERTDAGERASDVCVYASGEIERVVRIAAAAAQQRRGRLTMVHKANVLETSRLWRDVSRRLVADEFPAVQLDLMLVDACAMHLLRRPADFDVIVTENLFGDILTDEAAMLVGSLGLLPSAAIGLPEPGRRHPRGLYEPVHGSAPDLAGRGIANPVGAILSAALLLRHSLGLEPEARAVEAAVRIVLTSGLHTADVTGIAGRTVRTRAFGEAVAGILDGGPRRSAGGPQAPARARQREFSIL